MSIIRVVHNRENPFVQLNKAALWDESLSLRATGLWARCMSRPDNWQFNVSELAAKCKEGKKVIYKTLQELAAAGYVMKMEGYDKNENGKFNKKIIEYVFFEYPATEEDKESVASTFKKCFRRCHFGDVRFGNVRNGPLLISKEETKKEEEKEIVEHPSQAPSVDVPIRSPDIPKFSERALEEAKFLRDMILKRIPGMRQPNLSSWAEDLEKINRIDKRSWDQIHSMIAWISEDDFWVKVILSPKNLRAKWDQMQIQQVEIDNKGTRVNLNRASAHEAKSVMKGTKVFDIMLVTATEVSNLRTGEVFSYDMPRKAFDAAIARSFGLIGGSHV